jgi:branched-chain amino acid transport system ATP-binding protein
MTANASATTAAPVAAGQFFACRNIHLDLGGREILRDVSLELRPGEVLGIIGPNGAGKTSLLEVLSGRLKPKSGSIYFRDQNVTPLRLYERARLGIGRTYQTPVVPEDLTVGEVLKGARQAYRPYRTRHHAEWACELVGLVVDERQPAQQLETLNRRKLLLACLLMRRCTLLLLDEPAAGMINSEIDEFDHLIRVLSKELNIGIVIVEHRIELLDTIADRVMVMDAGETLVTGTLAEILADRRVHAAYFETVDE